MTTNKTELISSEQLYALTSVSSILLTKYLAFDSTTALSISNLIPMFFKGFQIPGLHNLLYLSCFAFVAYYLYKNYEKPKEEPKTGVLYSIYLYDRRDINAFQEYMRGNPSFFELKYSVDYSNPTYSWRSLYSENYVPIFPTESTVINFNDTSLSVKGFIEAKILSRKTVEDGKEIVQKSPYLVIHVLSADINGELYMRKIYFWKNEQKKLNDEVTIFEIKIMCNNNSLDTITSILYKGKVPSREDRYDKYIKPYFSPYKNELWAQLSTIHYEEEKFLGLGQNPNMNLLLYGPPGSGKSTFAYRIAMALGRHIVSLDLTCTDSRKDIYKYFKAPTIDEEEKQPKDFVLLLEEFDHAIDFLLRKKEEKKLPFFSFLKNGGMHLEGKVSKEEEAGKEAEKKEEEKKKIGKTRDFSLEDLLELFQGAVPLRGSIIIATTNHFDRIKEALPALVRPGRLTPINFDNLNWDTLQELVQYYFKETLPEEKRVKRVEYPTSQIIELAVKSSLDEKKGFTYFTTKLYALLETQKL